jgi:hypothetical protein
VLAKCEGEIVHRQDDAVAVRAGRGATAACRRVADAQLGKVERVARQVRDELLRRKREEALSAVSSMNRDFELMKEGVSMARTRQVPACSHAV